MCLFILRIDSRSFIIGVIGCKSLNGHTDSFLILFHFFPFYLCWLDIDLPRYLSLFVNYCIFRFQLFLLLQHVFLDVDWLYLFLLLLFIYLGCVHSSAIHKIFHLAFSFVLVLEAFFTFELGHGLVYSGSTFASWL